jgi:CheY-like chemotaxis protein/glycine cleavage system H lipoate-binding protein
VTADAPKPVILVVDDEEIVRQSVDRILRDHPYAVEYAATAEEALDRLGRGHFDLVITDLMLPGMSGLELLRRLAPETGAPGVIMITGHATIRTAVEALRLGAVEYVAKPFSRLELQRAVLRALRGRDVAATETAAPELAGEADTWSLRGHSWVRVLAGGEVLVGFEVAFLKVVGEISGLELPEPGTAVVRGRPCARLESTDGHTHGLWAPVAGKVVAVNDELRAAPRMVRQDPYGRGWVLRVAPENLEADLKDLARR